MNICFYTMANLKMMAWARRLISSGDVVNRPIWLFNIPPGYPDPKRYKLALLNGDRLPEADKYVYIDADSIMLKHGDWESEACYGAINEKGRNSAEYRKAMPEPAARKRYMELYDSEGCPPRMNSGLFVISNDIRYDFPQRWQYWNELIDSFSSEPSKVWIRDQIGFAYLMKEFRLPTLPGRFCCLPKLEALRPEHILIHAAGKPSGNAIKSYKDAVSDILGGYFKTLPHDSQNYRWQVLTRLLAFHAEDTARPVMAEIGVFKGETTRHMLNTFPGLKVHCVDNREPMGAEKRHGDTESVWGRLCAQYNGRIINYRMDALKAEIPDQLDGIFEDSDHRTDAVIAHAKHFWPKLKVGGFYAVHDINYKGTYYDRDSVKRAMDTLFHGAYQLGPDHTAWVIKQSESIPG